MTVLGPLIDRVRGIEPMGVSGRLVSMRGLAARVADFHAPIGSIVRIGRSDRLGEVVGFDGRQAIAMLYDPSPGARSGDRVHLHESAPSVLVGEGLLGRVVDGFVRPIDGRGAIGNRSARSLYPAPMSAMSRARIRVPMATGVRAIDTMVTLGRGQRLGIFAGPGVGKSTLLGMLAQRCSSDVNVIALIGERGREVRDFVEDALGEEGLRRSVVVVATSDESPLLRVRAAHAACAIAEHFRERGGDAMLMIDSVTRFAHAQRQIGLTIGEPPATRGYTPSVFAALPTLLERAGCVEAGADGRGGGSITGLYTVLVEGDDMTEPIADAVRGILDGHLMLSRRLAQSGRFPAIDVLDSISRLADEICAGPHVEARRAVRRLIAAHREVEELLQIGAYVSGSNPVADRAIALSDEIDGLLMQRRDESEAFEASVERLRRIAAQGVRGGGERRGES
ncbi:MAG: FliI/YscN family ATPase [Phycisphaerales bacterium]